MNKIAVFAISLAVTGSVLAVPIASQEIVVSPRSDTTFVEEVSQDLEARLAATRIDPRWDAKGIVQVRFQAGGDGRPTNIAMYRSSGNSQLDRAARRAVSGLTSLDPMPVGSSDDQVIQANILVASSDAQMARLTRKLARDEAARIARSPRERAVLALTLAPRPVS
ncbi:TonB family protein [Qipengyuania sp. RANM35]|uniref:TonB family protein n=1 Tax=Qipengyuania sp. RANM35 TaxID=3068635 RepID=UPI0034DAE848